MKKHLCWIPISAHLLCEKGLKGFYASFRLRVLHRDKIVISSITYAELRYGAIGKKLSPKHNIIVDDFMERLDAVLAWDLNAVDATVKIKKILSDKGKPIGNNDTMIAGHAVSAACVQYERV